MILNKYQIINNIKWKVNNKYNNNNYNNYNQYKNQMK